MRPGPTPISASSCRLILEAGERDGRLYSIDRRFSGRPFSPWLAQAEPGERRTALLSFLDATARLAELPSPVPGFARLVGPDAPAEFNSAAELARNMLVGPTLHSRSQLGHDLPKVAGVWERLQADLSEREVAPVLVHGDVCPPNAYLSMGPDGPVVTGIGDFSPHTVHGDPMMDVTGAVAFLELEPYADAGRGRRVAGDRRRGALGRGDRPLDQRLPALLRVLLLQRLRVRPRPVRVVPAAARPLSPGSGRPAPRTTLPPPHMWAGRTYVGRERFASIRIM